jgi:hypothetical protein
MERFLGFIIVVLAVTASAEPAGGEGGAFSKRRKRNGWNAFALRTRALVAKNQRRGLI